MFFEGNLMSKKIFYIFRHGETDFNKEGRWQGAGHNPDLNLAGIAQAHILAETLRPYGLQKIYSSPLKRALHTAEIIGEVLSLPVEVKESLIEGNFGVNEGQYHQDIIQTEEYKNWRNLDAEYIHFRFEGGESKYEIMQRMFTAISEMLNTPEEIIGISSHSAAIRCLMLQFGIQMGRLENGALLRLTYDDGHWSEEEIKD